MRRLLPLTVSEGARPTLVRVFEGEFQLGLVVLAGSRAGATALAAAHTAKHGAEEVRKIGPAEWVVAALGVLRPVEAAAAAGGAAARAGLLVALPVCPQLVVLLALVVVAEYFVGLVDFLEFAFRLRVIGVHIRMVLAGQLAVGLLDLVLGGRLLDAQRFVVVLVVHGCQKGKKREGKSRYQPPANRLSGFETNTSDVGLPAQLPRKKSAGFVV